MTEKNILNAWREVKNDYHPPQWATDIIDKTIDAIVEHHAQGKDDLCWMDDDKLYAAAGLPPRDHHVGCQLSMVQNCVRYIKNRTEGGVWPTYAELEKRIRLLEAENNELKDKLRGKT